MQSYCRDCQNKKRRDYYFAHPEKRESFRLWQLERYATDPDYRAKVLARNRQWYANHPDEEGRRVHRSGIKRRHGISEERYEALLES